MKSYAEFIEDTLAAKVGKSYSFAKLDSMYATYVRRHTKAVDRDILHGLKTARSVMRFFGLWKPGTPDTDAIRRAITKAGSR